MSIVSLVLFLTLLCTLVRRLFQYKKRIVFSNPSSIVALLDPPGSTISELLLARATPNTRLIHSFGARDILRHHTRNFPAFPDVVREVVMGSALRLRSPSRQSIPFATFIQVVTLRVVISSLFGGYVPEDSDDDTVFVVEAINELWTLSKKSRATPTTLLDTLNTHLRQWMPEEYERPLDFVIPAYETMWRVVAATVARAINDRGACAAFSAYLESPNQDQFTHFEDSRPQQPSVEAFINEVLRLHPPSRGLARAAPSRLWAPSVTHVADIEVLHKDATVWGRDAEVFDPMRFHESRLSYGQKHAFLPFSCGPLRCVAFKEAPRFAAIVAAVVLEIASAPDGGYQLICGEKIGRREGWDGWTIDIRS